MWLQAQVKEKQKKKTKCMFFDSLGRTLAHVFSRLILSAIVYKIISPFYSLL